MSDALRQESGARLADQLRRIREARGLTLQDVNNETKIPVSLLTAFEKTALFDHEQFNRVYLRSVVRTYAAAIGIPGHRASEALDAAFEGTYADELAREYLGEEAPAPPPQGARLAEERPSVPSKRLREEEPPPTAKAAPPVRPSPKRDPDSDWTSTSPPSRRAAPEKEPKVRASKPRKRKGRDLSGWIFAVIGVALLGGLIFGLLSLFGGESTHRNDSVSAADTAAVVAEPEPEPVQTQPAVTLGDVIEFYIVAASDKLDPVRVTVDNDLRRPFWLEQGDSLRFEAQERIVFEDRLDRARVTVEGYEYPMNRTDDQGRLSITREDARAFFDGRG
jgi:transcriptional regulator with XRE-family HTH domain